MDYIIKDIMKCAEDGDFEKVRHIMLMNLRGKYRSKLLKKIYKLRLKKQIIVQNLDVLNVLDLLEYDDPNRFNMKFWKTVLTYQMSVANYEELVRLGYQLSLIYKKKFINMVATEVFYTPKANHDLTLNFKEVDYEVLNFVILGINDASKQLEPALILKYVGKIFPLEAYLSRNKNIEDLETVGIMILKELSDVLTENIKKALDRLN